MSFEQINTDNIISINNSSSLIKKKRKLCPHNRQRSKCKECGGSSICQHKRQRSQCKECGGASICEHQRIRSKCKECHNLYEDGIDILLKAASQI